MGYSLYPIFFYLRGIIRNKKMATTLHFNITTKKVKVDQDVSQDLYGIITGPSGVAFVTKNSIGNELIDGDVESIYFNLPLDTSNSIVYGTYTLKYGTAVIDPNNSATYTAVSFTYLGADTLTACFSVEHNCDYYPTGLITATDSTYYGSNDGTATSPEILSRTISLYYPDGLVDPTPAVNPAVGEQSPITTGAYTLTVDTLATGMWTAIMDVQLLYTQEDDLVIEYQLKKTLNHNVACVGQLCSINGCIDGMTQAYNSDVACGVTTPRYAKQLTLINAYFSQYQMERACGNTTKANEYLNLMNELVSGTSTCSCSSGSCSGSCGSSCSCDSCGDDNTPRWINTPGSTTQSILEQIQSDITNIEEDIVQLQDEDTDIWNAIGDVENNITTIQGDITTIEGDITTLQADVEALQPKYKVYTALMSQTGTNAPTATILENTIGAIVWTRVSAGVYRATLADTFLIDKLFIPCPNGGFDSSVNTGGGGTSYKLARNNDAIIQLTTSSADDVLNYTPIEIRVYN
jgi:hypothetical protein